MTTTPRIEYDLDEHGVGVLTLNNPPLNLNTVATIDRLRELCRTIAEDDRVRTVVVTGAGDRAFCAGSDITEFADVRDDVVPKKLREENAAFTAIEQLPQPVIAALNGVTLGGGAELALACDIRIMAEHAQIGFPEVNLGVFPGSGGVFRLPRIVGLAHAYELLYTGDPITAAAAQRIGLATRIAEHGQALSTTLDLAHELAKKPALAVSLIRAAARDAAVQTTEEATQRALSDSHQVFTGPDIEDGIAAFFDKRTPHFTATRRA